MDQLKFVNYKLWRYVTKVMEWIIYSKWLFDVTIDNFLKHQDKLRKVKYWELPLDSKKNGIPPFHVC